MSATIIAVIAAVSALPIGTVVGVWAARRKVAAEARHTDADADATTVSTALSLIGPMKKRIDDLDAELAEMRALIAKMRDRIDELEMHDRAKGRGIRILTSQITDLGAVPGWPEQEKKQ